MFYNVHGDGWQPFHFVVRPLVFLVEKVFCLFDVYSYPCIPMFSAVQFLMPKTWQQPTSPPTDEQIQKIYCEYTMEYYSLKGINLNCL